MKGEASLQAHCLPLVRSILERRVISNLADPGSGDMWLSSLMTTLGGQLLAICMAIDLCVGAVPAAVYIEILNSLPPHRNMPCQEFAEALTKKLEYASSLIGSASAGTKLDQEDHYVRVMEIGEFAFYYDKQRSGRGLRPEEVSEVEEEYFAEPAEETLAHVGVWTGKNGRVWVVAAQDLQAVRPLLQEQFPGTPVMDAIGLNYRVGFGINGTPRLVAVHYPESASFDPPPRQPTAIDADWAAEHVFYVSYGSVDHWGRTHSCSGVRPECRERIHHTIYDLTEQWRCEKIGDAEPVELIDLSHVLLAACERFTKFCPGEPSNASV